MDISAEDRQLVSEVESVMAEDVHGARSALCVFGSLLRSEENAYRAEIYRRILNTYVARRKLGEKISMRELRARMDLNRTKIINQVNKVHGELNILWAACPEGDTGLRKLVEQLYECLGDVEDYYWNKIDNPP
jgi:hypothetical protein